MSSASDHPEVSRLPFIWPSAQGSTPAFHPGQTLPFEHVLVQATHIFGVVSAVDDRAVEWMEAFLADRVDTQLRLVISVYPGCRTSETVLQNLLRLTERHIGRARLRLHPEASWWDRASNLLCLVGDRSEPVLATGPTENLGLAPAIPSQANLVCRIPLPVLEACRQWFDCLWASSGVMSAEGIAAMPKLVLTEADPEVVARWAHFRQQFLTGEAGAESGVRLVQDEKTGEIRLENEQGVLLESVTETMGVQKLDPFFEEVAHLLSEGLLVWVDQGGRIPPLETPIKPEWIGVEALRERGTISARTSVKVSPFEPALRRRMERYRTITSELLSKFSFPFSHGVRWIPRKAIPLFESALEGANREFRELLDRTVGGTVREFLEMQHDCILQDAQQVYTEFHPGGKIPSHAVHRIMNELLRRLEMTVGREKMIPSVCFSSVDLSSSQISRWSNSWDGLYSLLLAIAEFPRKALADTYFFRGSPVDPQEYLSVMDVLGDRLLIREGIPTSRDERSQRDVAYGQLHLIQRLKTLPAGEVDNRSRCWALWSLMTRGREHELARLCYSLD